MSQQTETRYFIAVPGDEQGEGIYGIGTSREGALQDVETRSGWKSPTLRQLDDGTWRVTTDTDEDADFQDESEAREYAWEKGFIALECTKALYDYIDTNAETPTRWEENAEGLQDFELDLDTVEEIVSHVMECLDDNVSQNDGADYDVDAEGMLDVYASHGQSAELAENPRLNEAVIEALKAHLVEARAAHLEESAAD